MPIPPSSFGPAAGRAAGSVVIATLEGTRPLLVEIQALVSPTGFGVPRRSATGIDYNRLVMLLAVLEKREGLPLSSQDAYANAVGGVRVEEPAADLGIVMAIASSYRGVPCPEGTIILGEVGLAGEVRAVNRLEQRLKEGAKLGFKKCSCPGATLNMNTKPLELVAVQAISKEPFAINTPFSASLVPRRVFCIDCSSMV